MMGDGGLGDIAFVDENCARHLFRRGDLLQDFHTRGIGDRPADTMELLRVHFIPIVPQLWKRYTRPSERYGRAGSN